MPRKHYCYTRSIFYGIGEGGGGWGGCKSDYKDCFRSQKLPDLQRRVDPVPDPKVGCHSSERLDP